MEECYHHWDRVWVWGRWTITLPPTFTDLLALVFFFFYIIIFFFWATSLPWIGRFWNNLAQMLTPMRQSVATRWTKTLPPLFQRFWPLLIYIAFIVKNSYSETLSIPPISFLQSYSLFVSFWSGIFQFLAKKIFLHTLNAPW